MVGPFSTAFWCTYGTAIEGAHSSAIVYTLVETAKANNVDPYAYLLRVLSLLLYLGKTPANAELDELLPWHPRMQASLRRMDHAI